MEITEIKKNCLSHIGADPGFGLSMIKITETRLIVNPLADLAKAIRARSNSLESSHSYNTNK